MSYVTEQTSAELRAHIKMLQAMAGWHDPLVDRLYKEIQALDERNVVLLEALEELLGPADDPRIGWLGRSKMTLDHFRCEHCGAEDLDCTKQPHKPDCRVVKARAAIAKATGA